MVKAKSSEHAKAPAQQADAWVMMWARSSGELHGRMVRQLDRDWEEAKRDPIRMMRNGVSRMVSLELLSKREADQINGIVAACTGKDADPKATLIRVRQIYDELEDENAGPVAIAIASIAVNSATTGMIAREKGGGLRTAGDILGGIAGGAAGGLLGAAVGAVGGLLGGMAVGGAVGGPPGAVVGGGAGATVGAVGGGIGGAVAGAQQGASWLSSQVSSQ